MKNVKTLMNGVRGEEKAPKAQGCGAITHDVASRTARVLSRIGSMSLKNTSLFGVILALLLTFGVGEMKAATIFNCGIDVNDTWYKGTGTINSGNWLGSKTAFNGANLGALTSMTLGGQYDTWDNNQTDYCSWNGNNGIHILIKKGSTQITNFKLTCYHDSKDGNNNVWKTKGGTGSCSDSGSWGTYTVDISGYAAGNDYTIKATWTSPSSQSNNATANFTINPVVTFKANGGTGSDYTQRVTYNTNTALTANTFTKTGYDFAGWATSADGDVVYAGGANVKLTAHTNLFAKWTAKTTTITLNNAGATTSGSTSVTATYGEDMPAITCPTKTGYTFGGYWGAPGGSGPKYYNADGSSNATWLNTESTYTLYAAWAENKSTITLVASPSGKGTFQVGGETVTSTLAGVATTPAVTAMAISGYRFSSWSISGGASISSTTDNPTTVTGGGAGTAATLTATFVEDLTYYTLQFGARSGETSGSVAAKDDSDDPLTSGTKYLSGTSVTLTATATDDDYKFDSWYPGWTTGDPVSTDNPLTFSLSADTKRYAHFVQKTTSITLNKGIGSGGTAGPVTATHGSTTLSTNPLVCPAKSGYTFTGYWTEASGGVKVIDTDGTLVASVSGYTKSGNKKWDYDDPTLTLYAQYTEKLTTVTINVSPASSGTLTLDAAAFTPGNTTTAGVTTSHSVVATAANDYTFSSWSVSGNATGTSLTNTYTLKGNGSAGTGTLTANFTLTPCKLYKVSVAKNGSTTDKGAMSYDATEHAYYKDITTDASPYYFRFYYNDSEQYCSDWSSKAGGDAYSSGKQIPANDSKIDCDQSVGGWGDKPAMYYNGESGTTIRIWFDFQNKKVWITADKDKEYVLRGAFADDGSQADGMPGWSATTSYFDGLASGNTGTISCTLNASEWYHAKIYNVYTKTWYGPSSDTGLSDGTLSTATAGGGGDFYFQATIAGSYMFTLDLSSGTKMKVDYPSAYSVTYSAHTIAGTSGESDDPTATYNSGASSVSSGGYVPSSTSVTFTAAAAKSGYTYNGWYDAATGGTQKSPASSYSETVSGNITRYARYTQNTHSVTLTNANSTYGTVNTSSPVTVGEAEAVQIQATPKSGYMFNGWTKTSGSGTVTYHVGAGADQLEDGSGASKATTYITTTGNVTLQATWDEDRSSGYYLRYGNSGKDGDGNSAPGMAFDWTTEETDGVFYKNPGETTGTVSYFTLTCGGSDVGKVYEFKVTDHSSWYGYNAAAGGKIDATITDQTLNTSYGNGRLCIVMPGSYVFKWDSSTKKLSVTFPTGCYLRGTFNSWGWGNLLEPTGNANEYACTVSLSAKQTWAAPDYGFKVVIDGVHYGKNSTSISRESNSASSISTSGSNIGLATDVAGNYTFTVNTSSKNLTVTYPTAYTVTFGYGTGGSAVTATATNPSGAIASGDYVASGTDVTFTQTPATAGYTFKGWYTTADGNTTVSTMGVSDHVLNSLGANATVYAQYTPNDYTVTFDYSTNGGSIGELNGATNTAGVVTKSVTHGSTYGELPTATKSAQCFMGWYTASDGGTKVTSETAVSITANQTLYARFESIYEVTVQYKSGSVVLSPQTKVNAAATECAAEISAPEILGYTFSSWSGSNATFADYRSATTTVKASALTTITANYSLIPTVYFKNNLSWEHVYVTFDNTWTSSVPCNNGKPYYEMTQLGESDIFYCVIPDTYTASDYAGWKGNIAFDNHGFDASENVGAKTGGFDTGEFLGRGDFDPKATMFIPYNGDSETRNGGTYYRTGCWMKYNSTQSGYSVKMNTWVNYAHEDTLTVDLTADVVGGFEFSATVNLQHPNYTYGFKLYKDYQKNTSDLYYSNSGEVWATTTSLPWDFATKVDDVSVTADSKRCGLHTEALGKYKIIVTFGTGRPVVDVVYPVSVNDWRLVYKDRATWSNGAHTASWYHPSRVIKAKADAEDIVSFYVSKADGANATVELQKCTAIDGGTGAQTWEKQGENLDLSAITGTGIYNFKVTQNGSKEATAAYDGSYDGNFYIRTDASDGGWSNYKTSGANTMTYSEYSVTHGGDFGPYSHYYMRYVTQGSNIKFCIANDYSECISDTVVSDDCTNEWIEANGNVRFMWYYGTNKIGRAYISGSSEVSDRFLVLEGDNKMFNASGTDLTTGNGRVSGLNEYEMNFTDDQNWIYEATVQAQPGSEVKLTAKYNGEIQYFYGSEESTVPLLGGSGDTKYTIRIVYDFKTNRLIKAFIPAGTIEDDLSIEADLMIIREHQEDAQQITFNGGSLSEVKTVYGAMKFNKWTVNNKSKTDGHALLSPSLSRFERDLFYISFPFDVKLSDAFGFGTYGKHWIIEYYDGKGRAKNGFWADSPSNWKFVLPSQRSSFTLKAFEGYILALDLDEMTESSSVWNNDVEDVYVYFPSSAEVENIAATNRTITIDQTGYECTIGPRPGQSDDRRVKDSYWHMIGVPSFANYSSALKPTSDGSTIDWSSSSMPYLYEWNKNDNSLSITSSATFAFKATYAYMVQYSGASIYWSAVNVTPTSVVARKQDNKPASTEFRLELQQDEQKADQAFIRLTDEDQVTTGFDFNYDLSKEFNNGKANIYTLIADVQAAGNCLPMTEQTTIVPVGVKIATNADYTFSIPDGTKGVGVVLIDNLTGERTNLSAVDYTVSLEDGTHDDRFLLEISPIRNVATDDESVSGERLAVSGVRKVLIDGLLYIVRDNKMYDARGARVE